MVNSVHTNTGAAIALQALNSTNKQLDSVQKQISTGYRVNDAVDDGAAFAVAQGLRGVVKGYGAVSERLASSKGLLTVTSDALGKISDTLADAKATLTKLADAGLSTDERTQYQADFDALKTEVSNYVSQASFNSHNLLSTAGGSVTILFDASGGTKTLATQNIEAGVTAAFTEGTTAANAIALLTGAFATFQGSVGTSLSTIGDYSRSIDDQSGFISDLSDAVTTGIGNIVDADLAKASAKLQALQIRQQLGTQSLSIANQAPSILLSLFK